MSTAKAINLKVRPLQSVDLCFPSDGIVGEQSDVHLLGKTVTSFDLSAFYATLGTSVSGTNLGRLKFDSQAIRAAVLPSIFYELRAEAVKTALDKSIAQRENFFYQKYHNQTAVINQMQLLYGNGAGAKGARLQDLAQISQQQRDALDAAYSNDGRGGVQKVTASHTVNNSSDTSSSNSSNSDEGGDSAGGSQSSSSSTSTSTSDTTNTGYDYRHPSLENQAQFQRAQVSLLDEQFSHFLFAQNLPFLNIVFNNELTAIDLDVKRLQVAYLDTILVSPIGGVVTGVFIDKGDSVRSGQPVIRVENDEEILLVGVLKCHGIIRIGSQVSLSTRLHDTPTIQSVAGTVVSVRGHDSEDENWDVLILCGNRDSVGNPIFPVNYNFNFDNTTISITP